MQEVAKVWGKSNEALDMHASGYILKPITAQKIRKELENLRFPVKPERRNRVYFQTFGNFEVFIDEQPVKFKYDLTKEMLAYLVDRKGGIMHQRRDYVSS